MAHHKDEKKSKSPAVIPVKGKNGKKGYTIPGLAPPPGGGRVYKSKRAAKKGFKKGVKEEKKREKSHEYRKGERDTSSYKIPSGKKYGRIQRFQTLNQEQKDIQKKWGKEEIPEQVRPTKGFKQAQHVIQKAAKHGPPESRLTGKTDKFLERGMREGGGQKKSNVEKATNKFVRKGLREGGGAPTSPAESYGLTALQRALGQSPEDMLGDFEAESMRDYREKILPEIAARYTGEGNSSGYRNELLGSAENQQRNIRMLKANVIQQLIGQQLEGANVGLGYAQLPGQRYGQQQQNANIGLGLSQLPINRYGQQQQNANMSIAQQQIPTQRWQEQLAAAQTALPASMMEQSQQSLYNQQAASNNFLKQQAAMNTQSFGTMGVPKRDKGLSFLQKVAPAVVGGLATAAANYALPGSGSFIGPAATAATSRMAGSPGGDLVSNNPGAPIPTYRPM